LDNEIQVTEFDLDWNLPSRLRPPQTWRVQWHESSGARVLAFRNERHGTPSTTTIINSRCRLMEGEILQMEEKRVDETGDGNPTYVTETRHEVSRPPTVSESEFLPETYGIARAKIGAASPPWIYYAALGVIAVQFVCGIALLLRQPLRGSGKS
jgi:hypothetical protein